jgi:branched-chain amino acid transport system permease protein
MSGFYSSHVTLFQQTAIFVILALSFQVVLRSGVFSFASVGFYGIGAYATANLAKHGWPTAAVVLTVVVATALVGYALSLPLIRLRGLYLGMVTFAFDEILVVVANNGGKLTGGPIGLFGVSLTISTGALFALAIVAALLLSQLERRRLGRSLEMLRVDEQLARAMGVDVTRQRNFIFALSAALGSLAGVLNTITTSSIAPTGFGFDLIVAGLTMAVVGGVASWRGAVLGALIVVWFPEVFGFAGAYKAIVYGVLVILVVAFEPDGLLGIIRSAVGGIRSVRPRSRKGRLPVSREPSVMAVVAAPSKRSA